MFGSLRKKLKEAIEKVSKKVGKEEVSERPEIESEKELKESVEQQKIEQAKTEEEIKEVTEQETKIETIEEPKKEPKHETIKEPAKHDIESRHEPVHDIEIKHELPKQQHAAEIKTRPEERIEEEIDKKIEELEELKEKIEDEKLSPEMKDNVLEEEKALEEVKIEEGDVKIKKEKDSSFFGGFIKKITEKKLSEGDVEEMLKELQIALLENDVALEVAEHICSDVKKSLLGKNVKRGKVEEEIRSSLKEAIKNVLSSERPDINELIKQKRPLTIIFFGFNGTGKTTTIAKFANKFKEYSPVLAAGDTFRSASIEQLEEHSKRLGVKMIKHKYGSDSAAVIFDAKKYAESANASLVLADTAGRSHSDVNLMDELKKICRVNSPDMKILVLDALAGNDIYDQCKLFDDAVGVDALILTKADVYEKGGAAISASFTIKKPILYLGIGQNYEDLKEFNADEIVKTILD